MPTLPWQGVFAITGKLTLHLGVEAEVRRVVTCRLGGFYTHALVAVCSEMGVRFSITIRQHKGLRELIEAIPEQDWTPIPYWMDGAADVAETTYRARLRMILQYDSRRYYQIYS